MTEPIISKQTVEHIARLANLELTEEQIEAYTAHLASIIAYMKEIRDLDVSTVPETFRVIDEENVFREDEVNLSLTQQEALQNAERVHEGFFVIPAIFNSDDR